MPFTSRTPTYLTPEQRHALTQIPADLSDREIAHYYTFTQKDLDLIKALELLRKEKIIAPGLSHLERLIWIVLKAAEKQLFRLLTANLTLEHRSRLDGLLHADAGRRGMTRLSWLREPPGVTSAKSVKQIVERLLFLRGLELPTVSPTLHQNRVLQLARKCSKYQAQPLLKFKHESDLHIREHYTDTGGSTEQVFALAALLGFRFALRISDALSKKLYLLGGLEASGSLTTLAFGQINTKLIMEQWDEMRRVASSIRHGTVSASLLMRKLAAYPRQNQVARALTELGKLERTAFLLEYFRDESLRLA
jgi:hypothetical protein